jgi:hypothetical protein
VSPPSRTVRGKVAGRSYSARRLCLNDQASHAASLTKILLAISGSRDAGRAAFLPCLRHRVSAGREWLRGIFALVDASPR